MRDSIPITATQINYYHICRRKLWLFSHNINMEHNSELVELGKALHESSYSRKRKEIEFEGMKIDFFEKNQGLIHEVKKSKAMEESHIVQMKYYLYRLREMGIEVEGKIDYPNIRRTLDVRLEEGDGVRLESIVAHIKEIIDTPKPPQRIDAKLCKKCSYYELCYA